MRNRGREVNLMRSKPRKKGSLSLSVNAIVVFILAFAMLGVGLFFVNKIRGDIDIDTDKFLDPDIMTKPPSSENPLTIDDVEMKPSDTKDVNIGIYAKDGAINGVYFRMKSCTDAENNMKIFKTGSVGEALGETATCEPATVCGTAPTGGWLLPLMSAEYEGQIAAGEKGVVPGFISGKNTNALVSGHVYTCSFAAIRSSDKKIIRTTTFRLEAKS